MHLDFGLGPGAHVISLVSWWPGTEQGVVMGYLPKIQSFATEPLVEGGS